MVRVRTFLAISATLLAGNLASAFVTHSVHQAAVGYGFSAAVATPRMKIVMTVEGRASRLAEWQHLVDHMKLSSYVDIIYGSYDKTIGENCTMRHRETISSEQLGTGLKVSSASPVLVCLPIINTTYTPGRNLLGKATYRLQDSRGEPYKYWLFLDEDSRYLRCAMCEGATVENSCCFDTYIHYLLLDSTNHASIGLSSYAQDPESVTESDLEYFGSPFAQLMHNCFDAQFQSIHWEAVPIFFPYFEQLEEKSWWETHALSFYFSAACIPGAAVLLGGYAMSNEDHGNYPRGRIKNQDELAVLKEFVPELYYLLKPSKKNSKVIGQGNCAGLSVEGWQDPNYIFGGYQDNGWWRRSVRYLVCMNTLHRRFHEYMRS